MQCDQYREQLELMANTNAEEGDFAETRQHLKECTICQQNSAQMKKLDLLIQQGMNAITPPPHLAAQILARTGIMARKSTNRNERCYPLAHDGGSKRYLDI